MAARHAWTFLIAAVFAAPAAAETVVFRYGSTDYPTLVQAEAAMRASNGPAGGDLYACGVTPGSSNTTTLRYCTPKKTVSHWHDQYTAPSPYSFTCGHSNDRLSDYCASEGEVVSGFLAAWGEVNPSRCIVGQSMEGGYRPVASSNWAVNSYNPGSGVKRFASLNRNEPLIGDRRKLVFNHQACDDEEGPINTGGINIHLAQHYTCPSGYDPQTSSFGPWPRICKGPTATITKRTYLAAQTNPHSCGPCVPATGEKLLFEIDLQWSGVAFTRVYASLRDGVSGSALDPTWSHTWNDKFVPPTGTGSTARGWWRNEQGDWEEFRWVTGSTTQMYTRSGNSRRVVKVSASQWELRDDLGVVRTFDGDGQLVSIVQAGRPETAVTLSYLDGALATATDVQGRQLAFVHAGEVLTQIQLAGDVLVQYGHDGAGRLVSATFPGGKSRTYVYAEPGNLCVGAGSGCSASQFPGHITGVIDERGVRVLDITYDGQGRVVTSTGPLGHQATSLTYHPTLMQRTMTVAGAGRSEFVFEAGPLRRPLSRALYDGTTLIGTETWTYPSNGLSVTHVDRDAVATVTNFSAAGLQASRVDAQRQGGNTSLPEKRTTEWTWSADPLPQPVESVVKDAAGAVKRKEQWTYNARGQVATHSLIDPVTATSRVTTWAYCEAVDVADPLALCPIEGLLRTITAPGGAVTTYRYRVDDDPGCTAVPVTCTYRRGDLWQIEDAEGGVTELQEMDEAGRPVAIADPNGVVTKLTYNLRGWLTQVRVLGASAPEDAVISLAWTDTGRLASLTDADGVVVEYEYDQADRLVATKDALGARHTLTLDAGGNITGESVLDATSTLVRSLSRTFDGISRMTSEVDALANTTAFQYDAMNRLVTETNAVSVVTNRAYDRLGRPVSTVEDVGGIAASVQLTQDALDQVTQVLDPKGLATSYAFNGFGDMVELDSPDTGETAFTHDAAGNVSSREDARGVVATHVHDDLGRLTAVDLPGSTEDVALTWDVLPGVCVAGEDFGIGRLGTMVDGSGSTVFCHDRRSNLVRKVQTTGAVALQLRQGHTLADRLAWLEYPDGTRVDYVRNANGEVASMSITLPAASPAPLLGATWHPFGPVASIVWAGGRTQARPLDLAGRPIAVSDGDDGLNTGLSFDAVSNLTGISVPVGTPSRTVGYDALGRLTGMDDAGANLLQAYGYDATGNRTAFTDAGGTQPYSYPMDSHRLSSVDAVARTYDAAGNTLTIGTAWNFTYNGAGRMATANDGSAVASYAYNGLGEQVKRSVGGTDTVFLYDEAGRLQGQYDGTGTPIQQYVFLDDLPVAVIAGGVVYHVQPDHLGTPRAVVDPVADEVVWVWPITGEAFGNSAPDEDPDGDSMPFVFDLRFPGQRFDPYSGLSQNYFRDYDRTVGRYGQSDPIGLEGGVSTFAYVLNNPLDSIDPLGLAGIFTRCPTGLAKHCPWPFTTCSCVPREQSGRCGNVDCLLLGGNEPNTANINTSLCEYDRLGNNICYQVCMSEAQLGQGTNYGIAGNAVEVVGSDLNNIQAFRLVGGSARALDYVVMAVRQFNRHQGCLSKCQMN